MPRRAASIAQVKTHKYRAVPTEVDGVRFASKAEARRYGELKLLEKAGQIRSLMLQPELPLYAMDGFGDPAPVGRYVADFCYERFKWPGKSKECETIWEDVKGMDTPLSKWKRKHVKAQYGIDVKIVK